MARISDVELERLKREVSLVRLAEAKGVKLERRGKDTLAGLCPFHEEKTASFTVSPAKNVFKCFGCGAAGSVVDFVMKAQGVSFRHAVELLRNDAPLSADVAGGKSLVRRLPAPVDAAADEQKLLHQVVDYYHQTLKASPEALEYLKKRGLYSARLVEHFKLGFANRTLGLRLPAAKWKAGGEVRSRLQGLGVLRESGHEHLNGSLVVPLFDEAGAVVGMYGRKVTESLRPGTPLHLYLPGPHRAAFNSAALKGQRSAIVCEAVLDALTFWAAGFTNVTAAYGVDGFTPHHLAALKRHQVEDVLIAYDRDDAGDAGGEALAKRLVPEGFRCWRVQFPFGLDANAYALKVPSAPKALSAVLRQAVFMELPGAVKSRAPLEVAEPKAEAPTPQWRKSAAEREWERQEVLMRGMAQLAAVPKDAPASDAAPAPSAAVSPSVAEVAVPSSNAGERAGSVAVASSAGLAPASGAGGAAADGGAALSPANAAATVSAAEEISPSPSATDADEHVLHFGPRRYRVRGLAKNSSPDALKVNLLAGAGDAFHVDTFDLYQAKARAHFIAAAAAELRADAEVLKRDIGQLLLKLEELQEQALKANAAPKVPTLTEGERAAALELLKAPNLLERILTDFEKCGVVGEETNKLIGYLAAVSRKLEEPLAVLIQSSSAAGKSSLMEAVLAFVPDEDKVKYSAMTGQSLFYMGDADLKHKVLAVVEEEGAARASYALKLLQSEGELTIASTGKNPSTGRLETHEYHVEGPTQLFLTTTASELDEELLNRCLVLSVDEERGQTQAIHRLQREKQTLEGLLARREREATLLLHQNAQRLLRPLLVANPFARELTFLDDRTRARRDFPKYLTLIRSLALLHQHQRPVKVVQHQGASVEYIEVTVDDVATANRLAAAVLGRSLDELPPQTRRVLGQLSAWVERAAKEAGVERRDFHFTRRAAREALKLGHSQLALHLARLEALEYVVARRSGQGGGLHYQLLEAGAAARELPGLTDVAALRRGAPAEPSGGAEKFPAPVRGPELKLRPAENAKPALPLAALAGAPVEVSGVGRQAHSPLNGAAVVREGAPR